MSTFGEIESSYTTLSSLSITLSETDGTSTEYLDDFVNSLNNEFEVEKPSGCKRTLVANAQSEEVIRTKKRLRIEIPETAAQEIDGAPLTNHPSQSQQNAINSMIQSAHQSSSTKLSTASTEASSVGKDHSKDTISPDLLLPSFESMTNGSSAKHQTYAEPPENKVVFQIPPWKKGEDLGKGTGRPGGDTVWPGGKDDRMTPTSKGALYEALIAKGKIGFAQTKATAGKAAAAAAAAAVTASMERKWEPWKGMGFPPGQKGKLKGASIGVVSTGKGGFPAGKEEWWAAKPAANANSIWDDIFGPSQSAGWGSENKKATGGEWWDSYMDEYLSALSTGNGGGKGGAAMGKPATPKSLEWERWIGEMLEPGVPDTADDFSMAGQSTSDYLKSLFAKDKSSDYDSEEWKGWLGL